MKRLNSAQFYHAKNPKIARKWIGQLMEILLEPGSTAKKAIKYVTPTLVMKATLIRHGSTQTEVRLTMGRPNYEERNFVKKMLKDPKYTFPFIHVRYKKVK